MSHESQTSASEEEEPFISASSTTSKAASLPENLNGSEWEPSSSKATAGSDLAISSIEKLDGIKSFMAPLTKELMEKADALLKAQEEAFPFTTASDSINGWMEKTTSDPPPSITEVYHPLALSPNAGALEVTPSPQKVVTQKEEPMFPESGHSTPLSTSFTDPQLKAESPVLGKKGKISSSPKRPQAIGASAPTAASRKLKPKEGGLSILHSALEVPLEVKLLTSGKKLKATSTPQNLVV